MLGRSILSIEGVSNIIVSLGLPLIDSINFVQCYYKWSLFLFQQLE